MYFEVYLYWKAEKSTYTLKNNLFINLSKIISKINFPILRTKIFNEFCVFRFRKNFCDVIKCLLDNFPQEIK